MPPQPSCVPRLPASRGQPVRGAVWAFLTGITLVSASTPAIAAERVTLLAGAWARSVEIQDLRSLATTGEASGFLQDALRYGRLQPKTVQTALNLSIPLSPVLADRLLYSPLGGLLLDRIGQIISPRVSGQNGRQALRGAIVQSVARDSRFTLLELLENYPTDARLDLLKIQQLQQDLAQLGRLPF
nr:hypothetical protein DOP62_04535 [Synechococcus elongatus PCC 11801]